MPPLIPDLKDLHPIMHLPLTMLVERVYQDLGLTLEVFDFYRDPIAQDAAFAKGLSKKPAGKSWHNLTFVDGRPASLAAHVRVVLPNGRYLGFGSSSLEPPGARKLHVDIWDNKVGEFLTAEQMIYAAITLKAEEIGFVSGARWSTLQDWCHVEWHPGGLGMDQVKTILASGGSMPVWNA